MRTTGTERHGVIGRLYRIKRWMYAGDRPNPLARLMNRLAVAQFAYGVLAPRDWVVLEVPGRRTGRITSVPVVLAEHDGDRYLVSMLGENANWVRNVRAAGNRAVLRHGRRRAVTLEEVPVGQRAPILRRYLEVAPGARPHVPVDRHEPVAAFAPIAARYPVFRVTAPQ